MFLWWVSGCDIAGSVFGVNPLMFWSGIGYIIDIWVKSSMSGFGMGMGMSVNLGWSLLGVWWCEAAGM